MKLRMATLNAAHQVKYSSTVYGWLVFDKFNDQLYVPLEGLSGVQVMNTSSRFLRIRRIGRL